MKQLVTLTMIYNAIVEVDADSPEDAITLVENNLEKYAPDSIFQKGEKTVDFAEPITE